MNADLALEDLVRSQVSPQNYTYLDGVLMLKREGINQLTAAVEAGRLPGNPAQAKALREWVAKTFPAKKEDA
ncbi:MAG: hypothetical protein WC205_16830 [Opitutaceae bacterium]|jgi:hypothetical protein